MFEQKNREIRSLNEGLPILYLEELEQRVETDPLAIGNLFDQITGMSQSDGCNYCEYTDNSCDEYECDDCNHCKYTNNSCGKHS